MYKIKIGFHVTNLQLQANYIRLTSAVINNTATDNGGILKEKRK